MSARLRVTVLGCGSSGGVPRVGNEWGACDPNDPRNARTRCSLLVERYEGAYSHESATVVLIDTSPDMRVQLNAARVSHIDGLLYTHDHADQTHGIDDLRALVYNQRKRIPTWMDVPTASSLLVRFGYIFETPKGSSYPSLLEYRPMPDAGQWISIEGPGGTLDFQVLAQNHGDIDSLGFRFGPVAYCNDCKVLPQATLDACVGADLFIVDALRDTLHPSHANVAQALDWIEAVKPKHAILTNMHIDLDYAELSARLPEGVEPAVDGLVWDGDLFAEV
jgi:phosphoribosyl 1,2-cyclic phosphate phosphodiesterase